MVKEGLTDHTTNPSRPYDGQPWTDQGERGKQIVGGIRFRDLSDAVAKGFAYSTGEAKWNEKAENNTLNYSDLYKMDLSDIDPVAVIQNVCCEVEKMMGIYPNVPPLKSTTQPEGK